MRARRPGLREVKKKDVVEGGFVYLPTLSLNPLPARKAGTVLALILISFPV
jgi:hypothetical protein